MNKKRMEQSNIRKHMHIKPQTVDFLDYEKFYVENKRPQSFI